MHMHKWPPGLFFWVGWRHTYVYNLFCHLIQTNHLSESVHENPTHSSDSCIMCRTDTYHSLFCPSLTDNRATPNFYAVRNDSAYLFVGQWFYFAILGVPNALPTVLKSNSLGKFKYFCCYSCSSKSRPKLIWIIICSL